jgi:hypothetical protein
MSKRIRRRHSPEQKAALLKRQLVEKKPVSQVCNEAGIQPSDAEASGCHSWRGDSAFPGEGEVR